MKKLTALALLSVCAGFNTFAQKNIKITGTIANPTDTKLIVVNATNTNIIPDNKQEVIDLEADGKFTISIPVTQKYNWIILGNGKQRVDFFAKEGSELTFEATADKMDSTAHFEGKGKEIPQFFTTSIKLRGGLMAYYVRTQSVASNNPETYIRALDSVKNDEELFMKTNPQWKAVPKDFQEYWSTFLKYSVYDAMLHYPAMHEMYRQKTQNIQSVAPELYVIPKKTPKAFDDKYIDMAFYQTYVQSYYSSLLNANGFNNVMSEESQKELAVEPMGGNGSEKNIIELVQTDSVLHLLYNTAPKKTAAFAAGRIIATEYRPGKWSLAQIEARIAEYKKHFPQSEYNASLDKIVYDIKKFNPGMPALDFTFTTLEGKTVKLSDLKGKVVYMDFWASWCGPCKGEMPHAKTIKEHFKDRNDVVFLYVSIDDKEDAWKRGIEGMSISGMHTRTPGWKGDISVLYDIQTIPAYFLIDKKGNFVTKKTPRPSQTDEVIKLVEGLL